MALAERELAPLRANKEELRRIIDAEYKKIGIPDDPTATAPLAQQLVGECLRTHGLGPEDNIFSRGIVAARNTRVAAGAGPPSPQ